MWRGIGILVGVVITGSAAGMEPENPTVVIRELCAEWAGDWETVRGSAVWEAMGVDPGTLEWLVREEGEGLEVAAALRYRDIDCDGLADAFIGLHDGEVVHWFFAMAESPERWDLPEYLGRLAYRQYWVEESEEALPPRAEDWPASQCIGGRALFAVATGDHADRRNLHAIETIFEIIGGRPVVVLSDASSLGGRSESLGRMDVLGPTDDGSLVFAESRFDRGDHSYLRAWKLPAGSRQSIDFELDYAGLWELEKRRTHQPKLAVDLHELHPEVVASALSSPPIELLTDPIWDRLGLDPSKYEFAREERFQERARGITEFIRKNPEHVDLYIESQGTEVPLSDVLAAASRELSMHTVVAYCDFNNGGCIDAYVVMRQDSQTWWLLLSQPAPGEWECLELVGGLRYIPHWGAQKQIPDRNHPGLPELQHCNGRNLMVVQSGVDVWLGPKVRKTVYLIDEDGIKTLWSEMARSYESGYREVSIRAADSGDVILTVDTYENDPLYHADQSPVIHRYRLGAGSKELELLSITGAVPQP